MEIAAVSNYYFHSTKSFGTPRLITCYWSIYMILQYMYIVLIYTQYHLTSTVWRVLCNNHTKYSHGTVLVFDPGYAIYHILQRRITWVIPGKVVAPLVLKTSRVRHSSSKCLKYLIYFNKCTCKYNLLKKKHNNYHAICKIIWNQLKQFDISNIKPFHKLL